MPTAAARARTLDTHEPRPYACRRLSSGASALPHDRSKGLAGPGSDPPPRVPQPARPRLWIRRAQPKARTGAPRRRVRSRSCHRPWRPGSRAPDCRGASGGAVGLRDASVPEWPDLGSLAPWCPGRASRLGRTGIDGVPATIPGVAATAATHLFPGRLARHRVATAPGAAATVATAPGGFPSAAVPVGARRQPRQCQRQRGLGTAAQGLVAWHETLRPRTHSETGPSRKCGIEGCWHRLG